MAPVGRARVAMLMVYFRWFRYFLKVSLAAYGPQLTVALLLLGSFAVAHALAMRIELPFTNPHDVVGTLTGIRYNPSNNLVRFLVIVFFPSVALALLTLWSPERWQFKRFVGTPRHEEQGRRRLPVPHLTMLVLLTLIVALNARSYMSSGTFETFEEGLPLSAGMSYLNGQVPYRDFAFFHGLYDEPLRVAVAWKLFGKSIGAMRTLQSINKLLTFGFVSWLLIRLFRGRVTPVVVVLLVFFLLEPQGKYLWPNRAGVPFVHSMIVMPRDMGLFAFLVALTFIADCFQRNDATDARLLPLAIAWSALPGLAFIHSMERGVYLVLAFAILAPACYFLHFRHTQGSRLFVAGCLIGSGLSAGLLAVLVGGAFSQVARLMRFLASDDLQLQFSYPYPFLQPTYVILDLIIAVNCLWLVRGFLAIWIWKGDRDSRIRAYLREHFIEAALLMVSLLYYRNALGRADWIHVAYALPASLILFMYLLLRNGWRLSAPRFLRTRTVGIATVWIAITAQSGVLAYQLSRTDVLRENFPLSKSDAEYLPDRWKGIVQFFQQNLSADENFYTMSDELSLYYFVGKRCPVRFPLLDMVASDVARQREIISDLETGHVRYVLIDRRTPYFRLDGISNEARAPLVFEYVRTHFRPYRQIEDQTILISN